MHSDRRQGCETLLTIVINDWAKLLASGGQVDTVILDFDKVVDTRPHEPF